MVKKKGKNKKRMNEDKENFGTCLLYCKDCDYEFEVDWQIIFDIQEVTHGYVGFHLDDVFLNCPKCDEIISDMSEENHTITDTKKTKHNITLKDDDELPF